MTEAYQQIRDAIRLRKQRDNFCKLHQTLRVTPAMEPGITDRGLAYFEVEIDTLLTSRSVLACRGLAHHDSRLSKSSRPRRRERRHDFLLR